MSPRETKQQLTEQKRLEVEDMISSFVNHKIPAMIQFAELFAGEVEVPTVIVCSDDDCVSAEFNLDIFQMHQENPHANEFLCECASALDLYSRFVLSARGERASAVSCEFNTRGDCLFVEFKYSR